MRSSWHIFHILIFALASIFITAQSGSVTVIPNNSIIIGRIISIEASQNIVSILVLESADVPGQANFTKNRVGTIITARTREDLSRLKVGDTIRAEVSYRGDERGGSFWAKNISVLAD